MKSPLTTLCYVERGDSYLMLHRVSKKNDVNKDKWLESAVILRKARVRKNACCVKLMRKPDFG